MNKIVTYLMSILFVLALTVIAGWFLIYEPHNQRMNDAEDQIDKHKQMKRRYDRAKDEIPRIEGEIDSVKQEIFRKLCSAQGRSIQEFLREIEDDSIEAQIDLDSVRIDSISALDLWSRIPINMNVGGPYFRIFDFLTRVQKRGKLDFSSGSVNISTDAKKEPIPNLMKLVNQAKTKYKGDEDFPRLRVTLDSSEIIIIDANHLTKYKTNDLQDCNGV